MSKKLILFNGVLIIAIVVIVVMMNNRRNSINNANTGSGSGTGTQVAIGQDENGDRTIAGISVNDESYKDKKIYEEDGDIIIEGPDGSKTIQTTKTKEDTGMTEVTESEKSKYTLSDVKVEKMGGATAITGVVKNNDSASHNVVVNVKFYSSENRVKGAASEKVSVGAGESKDFRMTIMDDMTSYRHEIQVEYAD